MKVKDLIKELKKMPKDLDVGIAHHDNCEYEIAGWIIRVCHHKKNDYIDEVDYINDEDSTRAFKDNPKEWVTLHCH